ncbi:hypothetical protein D6827_00575 [Candidatus Parcubacteria bacterium]|nr:MAG: hypothetical protein D6827_00575 [Candidatus Parcubacteria bacterium]
MEKESKREILKTMPCRATERSISELRQEGWEEDWSFHIRFTKQWNDACDLVRRLKKSGLFECVLVLGQTPEERKDGVAYVYKKKSDKYHKFEKDMGYAE